MVKVYLIVNTKKKNSNQEVSIRIRIKDGQIDQATSTGETVKLLYWNLRKQELTKAAFKGKESLVIRLAKLKAFVLEKASQEECNSQLRPDNRRDGLRLSENSVKIQFESNSQQRL